jgi:hypothetical protein
LSARIVRDVTTSDIPYSKTIARANSVTFLEVVRRAVRHAAEHDLLGGTAAEVDLHQVDELFLRVQVTVLGGKIERVAESLAARNDRYLLHR